MIYKKKKKKLPACVEFIIIFIDFENVLNFSYKYNFSKFYHRNDSEEMYR